MSKPAGEETTDAPATPGLPLLTLRDGLPDVVETDAAYDEMCAAFARGTGPVAIDAERASGYRYSGRAYLVQLRREGAGTALVDPTRFGDLARLQRALAGAEWVVHAATQDLPCLAELGLRPASLFDTELAGRLLGYPRVGLATLVETILGHSMRKEHSAQDWSNRPLPVPWLEYAALDVEALLELRGALGTALEAAGKAEWARQEFDRLLDYEPPARVEPWRRTSGLHKVRGRRGLGAVRALWETRDRLARQRDLAPGRLLPDSALVAAALAHPRDRAGLLATPGFRGRGAQRYAREWVAALRAAAELPEQDLPARVPALDGPPPPRSWADRDPVAARRLTLGRAAVAEVSAMVQVPAENLLSPDTLRRLMWQPPEGAPSGEPGGGPDVDSLAAEVAAALTGHGARPWQAELLALPLAEAMLAARVEPPAETPDPGPEDPGPHDPLA